MAGSSISDLLSFIGNLLFIDNPDDRAFYHSALRVQYADNGECFTYVIELTEAEDDSTDAARVGETITHAIFGPWSYAIRLYRNGTIEDEARALPPVRLSNDCLIASNRAVLVDAQEIPALDYGSKVPTSSGSDRWTSNSVIGWLLQRVGLDPGNIHPPPNGMAPGWDGGRTYAWDHFP